MTVQSTENHRFVGIPIQLHGPRLLLLDTAALALAKNRFGINTKLPDIFENEMTVEITCCLLWAGVRHQGGGPKLKTIKQIVNDENVERYALLVARAIFESHRTQSVDFIEAFKEVHGGDHQ